VKSDEGKVIKPIAANILSKAYPMSRPLLLVTNGDPARDVKKFIDFVLSSRGQQLVSKNGYLTLEQLNAKN
jgi:phosphate transport system substrate-binding protein